MKYLKKFSTHAEYAAYIAGQDAALPNVSICSDEPDHVHFNPRTHRVGDVLFFDDTKLRTVPYTEWVSGLGTPIAVCVIPQKHNVYGNGKACWVGIGSDATNLWSYSATLVGTAMTDCPLWANDGQGLTGVNTVGYLPSDRFSTTPLYGDTSKGYSVSSQMSPCPFLPDGSRNPDYYAIELSETAINNPLSDFTGKTKTQQLYAAGPGDYIAASVCAQKTTAGTVAGDWYLPAMGEWGYVMANFNLINDAILACGGSQLNGNGSYWATTESSNQWAYYMQFATGKMFYNGYKGGNGAIRPFIQF